MLGDHERNLARHLSSNSDALEQDLLAIIDALCIEDCGGTIVGANPGDGSPSGYIVCKLLAGGVITGSVTALGLLD